jgi:hypothetical protein
MSMTLVAGKPTIIVTISVPSVNVAASVPRVHASMEG